MRINNNYKIRYAKYGVCFKGATLIETLIYCVVMGLVFTGIYSIFSSALSSYYTTSASIEVQRAALSATNMICKELSESNLSSVYIYSSTSATHPGIVFMSPRNSSEGITIDTSTGKPYWQGYVAYYVDTDPTDSSLYAIFRKEQPLSSQTATPSSPNPTYNTDYFAAASSLKSRVVAYKVDSDLTKTRFYWKTVAGVESYGTPSIGPIYIQISTKDTSTRGIDNPTTFETTTSVDVLN